jgi:hypothetical protein
MKREHCDTSPPLAEGGCRARSHQSSLQTRSLAACISFALHLIRPVGFFSALNCVLCRPDQLDRRIEW